MPLGGRYITESDMDIWEYIADLDYCPSCDECYAQQSYCEEHSE